MQILKGLVLGLLSLLLFLSLSVFGIAFMLESTILDPEFVAAEVDKIDISTLIKELTEEQVSEQLSGEMFFLKEAIYGVVSDQEPWLKEQVNAAIFSSYDFLLGKSERLSVTVSLESLKGSLRDSLWETFGQSIPPELSALPPDMIEQYFDEYYQAFSSQIPSEFEFNEVYIPPEVMEQIILVRQGIGYFQTGYNILIGFMVVLVLGIIFINGNIRRSTRDLGINFLIYGALELAGVIVARFFMPTSPLPFQIPSALQTWMLGLFNDILVPLQTFSIGVLVGGVVLIIASFFFKSRQADE
ncbi:hypothetical protein ACFLVB_03330 [Chloroflexota bacterium]